MADDPKNRSTDAETRKRVFVTHARTLSDAERQSLTEKEKAFEKSCSDRGIWLEIFCPDDACFTEEERIRIPVFCEDPKVRKKMELELFCPDDACEVYESTKLP